MVVVALLLAGVAAAAALPGLLPGGTPPSSPGPSANAPALAAPATSAPGAPSEAASPGGSGSPTASGGSTGLASQPPTPEPSAPTVEPEELTGYLWPVRNGRLSAFYDYRDSGFLAVGGRRIHEGVDVTTFCGDRVRAAHDGTVLHAGRRFGPHVGFSGTLDPFYARLERRGSMSQLPIAVVIDDGNGYRSVYVHLSVASVRAGDIVSAGDDIGLQGATGNASGCHLHYELIRMDGPWMAVAPELVEEQRYPAAVRERVDPLRVLSLDGRGAPRLIPGIDPPEEPPRADPASSAAPSPGATLLPTPLPTSTASPTTSAPPAASGTSP
jgi:murein DD-endopeptidase MepM/ murein hydrolase activator NlpD